MPASQTHLTLKKHLKMLATSLDNTLGAVHTVNLDIQPRYSQSVQCMCPDLKLNKEHMTVCNSRLDPAAGQVVSPPIIDALAWS